MELGVTVNFTNGGSVVAIIGKIQSKKWVGSAESCYFFLSLNSRVLHKLI
jgi:hypothetical protein